MNPIILLPLTFFCAFWFLSLIAVPYLLFRYFTRIIYGGRYVEIARRDTISLWQGKDPMAYGVGYGAFLYPHAPFLYPHFVIKWNGIPFAWPHSIKDAEDWGDKLKLTWWCSKFKTLSDTKKKQEPERCIWKDECELSCKNYRV